MFKRRSLRSWLRLTLDLLVWEAALLALAWLLRLAGWAQRYRFSDELLVIGLLALLTASLGMLGRPFAAFGPEGVPAFPVQPSQQEQREQMRDEYVEKKSFATRLVAAGLLTVLFSFVLSFTGN